MAQEVEHHQPDEQPEQKADEKGKEAGAQRQVVELTHLHQHGSKIPSGNVARMARRRNPARRGERR
jgi:hypothetical protein